MKIKKILLGLIITVTIPTLISCGNSKKKAAEKIENELNNRYGKTFVVDSVGGSFGTSDDSTIKAWCYEESNKDEMFKAAVKKDFSLVTDEYQALIIEKQLEVKLKSICDERFGDTFVDVSLGNEMTSDNTKYSEFEDYFKNNQNARSSSSIYIKTNSQISKEEECNRVSQFLNIYSDLNWRTGSMAVFFLHEDEFSKIQNEYKDIENEFEYYGIPERSYNYLWMKFSKTDNLNLEPNELMSKFEW